MFNLWLNEVSYYGCYLRKLHRTENFAADVKDFKTVEINYDVHGYERFTDYVSVDAVLFANSTKCSSRLSVDITLNLVFANFSSCLLVVVPAQCL